MINGTQLILNKVYDAVGFDAISDDVLRNLVIARICQPGSKMATAAYLKAYFKEDLNHWRKYRYMDKLYNTQQETVQKISVTHTMKVLGGQVGLMFYDVTLLRDPRPRRSAAAGLLKRRQDKRVPDYTGLACKCRRVSSFLRRVQRKPV